MKIYTAAELKEALEKHSKYLNALPGGEFLCLRSADLRSADLGGANLYGANLRSADLGSANLGGADLGSANLGSKTEMGKTLRLVGACMEAVAWVDAQEDNSDFAAIFKRAKPEWRSCLKIALGGEPTAERLQFVVDYVTKGRV